MREFGLRSDVADSLSQAIPLLEKSFREHRPYRLILFDLDDPTIFIGRVIRSVERLLREPENERVSIDVYAYSSDTSTKIRKKVASHKLFFLAKPLTRETCQNFSEKYPPIDEASLQ